MGEFTNLTPTSSHVNRAEPCLNSSQSGKSWHIDQLYYGVEILIAFFARRIEML